MLLVRGPAMLNHVPYITLTGTVARICGILCHQKNKRLQGKEGTGPGAAETHHYTQEGPGPLCIGMSPVSANEEPEKVQQASAKV